MCELHSWTARAAQPPVWDAVLFNTELDLLEIRWSELDSAVDRFFILENNSTYYLSLYATMAEFAQRTVTFTGLPKSQDFALNRKRFARFEHKIVYQSLAGTIEPHVEPFVVENKHRHSMNRLLRQHLPTDGPRPLVIFSDTDEIPSAHTIRLLKACKFPTPLHLRMRTFLYSFEWPYGDTSWRAQVHDWADKISDYSHSMQSNLALADSGWHCTYVGRSCHCLNSAHTALSYCFRYIDEFVTKMRGFSHADRVGGSRRLLASKRIQDVICTGKDIFDMLPEVRPFLFPDFTSVANELQAYTVRPLYLK